MNWWSIEIRHRGESPLGTLRAKRVKFKDEAERCMMEPAFLPIKDKCRDYRFISIEDIENESQKSIKILEKAHQRINRARQRIEEEEQIIREYRQKRFKLLPLTSDRGLG